MALDGAFLLAVKQELQPLVGGRIEKVYQPSKEEAVIAIRTRTGSSRVLICAGANSARIHITNRQIENPKVPPMFCMLLRKHLGSGKLIDIRQDGLERILFLDFETVNELGDVVIITLAVEIMGKYSNLIVINENGKIIDSLKRVDDAMSRERLVLPGMTYTAPPRGDRLNFLIAPEEEMRMRIAAASGKSAAKCLIGIFEGISPILASFPKIPYNQSLDLLPPLQITLIRSALLILSVNFFISVIFVDFISAFRFVLYFGETRHSVRISDFYMLFAIGRGS